MTRIHTIRDHVGPVKYTDPPAMFDASHVLSARHDRARDLVAGHDEIEFVKPIPAEYDDLRRIASALPTDRVDGNASADLIASFLEQFSAGEIERLRDDPTRLDVTVENRRELYEVAEPEGSGTDGEE